MSSSLHQIILLPTMGISDDVNFEQTNQYLYYLQPRVYNDAFGENKIINTIGCI